MCSFLMNQADKPVDAFTTKQAKKKGRHRCKVCVEKDEAWARAANAFHAYDSRFECELGGYRDRSDDACTCVHMFMCMRAYVHVDANVLL